MTVQAYFALPIGSDEREAAKRAFDAERPMVTPAQELAFAKARLARAEQNGRFWKGMISIYETMAAKWEEFSGEQFDREVEALKASDMVEACKLEWKRAKVALDRLSNNQRSAA